MAACRNRALSSNPILASRAIRSSDAVSTSGLISTIDASHSTNAAYRPRMNATALATAAFGSPSPKASWRPWKSANPTAGSMLARRIFSGARAATSSISTPPSELAMTVTREVAPVDDHAQIELGCDVAALLDEDLLHLFALGAGLMRDQRCAQQRLRVSAGFLG